MSVVLITGSSGLIGSEAARFFHHLGHDIVGIDNNSREYFFGQDGSVEWNTSLLQKELSRFKHHPTDIRNSEAIERIFCKLGNEITLILHCAAQPSHDWAAKEPITDFTINALGTLTLLEATRKFCPNAVFIFTSTNKVYGDLVNELPFIEQISRYELDPLHVWGQKGVNEMMSIDQTKHSVFGASKVSADIMVQEYGRYFGMQTAVFRGGCITGPAHAGVEMHGYLAYLVQCAIQHQPYTIFGHKGKQVRDNIHSYDLVRSFWHFFRAPRIAAVYNLGGSRHSNCSTLEAIDLIQKLSGERMSYSLSDNARSGDHIWWISDVSKFQNDYPEWSYQFDLKSILTNLIEEIKSR